MEVIRMDGTIDKVDAPLSLAQAQHLVGGYVEVVKQFKQALDIVLLVDEDARVKGVEINELASATFMIPLRGPVVVCRGRKDWKGWTR